MKHQSAPIFSVFAILLFAGSVFSQLTAPNAPPVLKDETSGANASGLFQVGEVRGMVNSKAVHLPKPAYPIEAGEAGAEGKVTVQITVDDEGNVISANALSGHPLLKIASEDVARRTKFRIARNAEGQAVKINGILTYNFTIQKAGWSKIGYDLAIIEKMPTLDFLKIPTILKAFQPEWTTESELLQRLNKIKHPETEPASQAANRKPLTREMFVRKSDDMTQKSAPEKRLILPTPATPEEIAISQNLISALQSRLGNDVMRLWQFNLGVNLSKALWLYRNPKERSNAAQILRQSTESAPPNVSAEISAELQKLVAVFERKTRTMETHNEIGQSLSVIFRNR